MSKRWEKSKPQQPQLNRQLEQSALVVKEKNENLIQLGKFFYSLAGMTYAGAVLTFVVDYNENNTSALLIALLSLVLLASVGWLFVKRGNYRNNDMTALVFYSIVCIVGLAFLVYNLVALHHDKHEAGL